MEGIGFREKWKKKKITHYAHFDYPVSLDSCFNKITDPDYVGKYAFYPFIRYSMKTRRLENKNGIMRNGTPKVRNIKYAAHLDSWIFRYYAYLVNEQYNKRVIEDGLNSVSVAYRSNLGKNNINFAYEAFSFIRDQQDCLVIIGDFKDFFDKLDHVYLKKQLKALLGVQNLSKDYYNVFKAVTKYSYVDIEKILDLRGLSKGKKGIKELNSSNKPVMSKAELEALSKEKDGIFHNELCGVPQGSPISAVLANVYMLEIDKEILEYCKELDGFYMRYSDDFMVVIPGIHFKNYSDHVEDLKRILEKAKVILEDHKTQTYQKEGSIITNLSTNSDKKIINFLGFSFDGDIVSIRSKTISKYYHKMYRKAHGVLSNGGLTHKKTKAGRKNLYKLYSCKGSRYYKLARGIRLCEKDRANFLDYVERAGRIFVNDPINKDTKRHMVKIKRKLEGKKDFVDSVVGK